MELSFLNELALWKCYLYVLPTSPSSSQRSHVSRNYLVVSSSNLNILTHPTARIRHVPQCCTSQSLTGFQHRNRLPTLPGTSHTHDSNNKLHPLQSHDPRSSRPSTDPRLCRRWNNFLLRHQALRRTNSRKHLPDRRDIRLIRCISFLSLHRSNRLLSQKTLHVILPVTIEPSTYFKHHVDVRYSHRG